MPQEGDSEGQWLRTNEKKEAYESLKFANVVIDKVDADPYYWKWVIIAAHAFRKDAGCDDECRPLPRSAGGPQGEP